jgi:hypothetical protein
MEEWGWGGGVIMEGSIKSLFVLQKRLTVSHFFELPQKFCSGVRCVGRSSGYYMLLCVCEIFLRCSYVYFSFDILGYVRLCLRVGRCVNFPVGAVHNWNSYCLIYVTGGVLYI